MLGRLPPVSRAFGRPAPGGFSESGRVSGGSVLVRELIRISHTATSTQTMVMNGAKSSKSSTDYSGRGGMTRILAASQPAGNRSCLGGRSPA